MWTTKFLVSTYSGANECRGSITWFQRMLEYRVSTFILVGGKRFCTQGNLTHPRVSRPVHKAGSRFGLRWARFWPWGSYHWPPLASTHGVPGAVLRPGCHSLTFASGKRTWGPGAVCTLTTVTRIWGAHGLFPSDYQHILAVLLQTDVVLEKVHNQRALPINVEEVWSQLRAFAGSTWLRMEEKGKMKDNVIFTVCIKNWKGIKALMCFDPVIPVLGCILRKLLKIKKKKSQGANMSTAEILTVCSKRWE